MKILLTYASIDGRHREENKWDYDSVNAHYPLGLAYLSSYLEGLDLGYEVRTEYLNKTAIPECLKIVEKEIEEFKPDVVGISLITHSRIGAFRMIEFMQEKYPHIHVVIGGMHVSVTYKQLAERYPGVVCVIGEGEITLGELAARWSKGESIADVNGIAYNDGENTIITPPRELIDNLDMLPFPKHSEFLNPGQQIATMLTSRGCPYKCNFCVLDSVSRRKVRCRSAKNIEDEIEFIKNNHPTIDTIWFHDDAFMIIKERTIEFCEEIIRRGVKVKLICSARFRPISRKVVMLMKEAGFIHVLFGLESGAPTVLKQMKKGLTQKSVRHGLKLFSETKIKATAFLIVGLPGEDDQTIDQTIDFVQELQDMYYMYYDDIGVAQAYPGTELYTLMKEAKTPIEGYGPIDDGYWLTDGKAPLYTTDHTEEQLFEWKDKIQNAISFNRMMNSPENFLKQRKLMPGILDYSWRWGFSHMVQSMMDIIGRNQSMIVNFIKAAFLGEPPSAELNTVRYEIEKQMITSFLKTMTDPERKEFIGKYKKQKEEDEAQLANWRALQEAEHSGYEVRQAAAVVTTAGDLVEPLAGDTEGYTQYSGTEHVSSKKPSDNRLKIVQ